MMSLMLAKRVRFWSNNLQLDGVYPHSLSSKFSYRTRNTMGLKDRFTKMSSCAPWFYNLALRR